jgi:hypothetical protein
MMRRHFDDSMSIRTVGFVPRLLRYATAAAATAPRRLAYATISFPLIKTYPHRRLRPSPPPLCRRCGCDGSSPSGLRYDFVSFDHS